MWGKLSLGLLVPTEQDSQSLGYALKTPKMYIFAEKLKDFKGKKTDQLR